MRLEITELSTHLQGQLVAVHPATIRCSTDLHRKNSAIIQKPAPNGLFSNYNTPLKLLKTWG